MVDVDEGTFGCPFLLSLVFGDYPLARVVLSQGRGIKIENAILWELALPAIECAALVIQAVANGLAAPASSPARPACVLRKE
ncbi:hypothetical protein D3C77_686710 [compost metagenome]